MTGRGGVLKVLAGALAPLFLFLATVFAAVSPASAAGDWGLSISDSPDPVVFGNDITYTITLSGPGQLDPGDNLSINFTDVYFSSFAAPGGWSCTNPGFGGTGTVSCTVTGAPASPQVFTLVANAGTDTSSSTRTVVAILASAADPNSADNMGTATTSVVGDSTTTTMTSSVNPSLNGQTVLFTATVVSQQGGTPEGTVSFYDPSFIGTVTLDEGQATLAISSLTPGTHPVMAYYNGSATHIPSFSTDLDQEVLTTTVAPEPTTTTVLQSSSTSFAGDNVVFTAVVQSDAGSPEGIVEFFDAGGSIGAWGLDEGQGSISVALPVGSHSITAAYTSSNSLLFDNSTSSAISHLVRSRVDAVVASSGSPTVAGESVTFTATLSAVAPGSGTPNGSVTFLDGSTSLGTAALDGAGQATLTTSALTVGSHSISVSYAGTTDFGAATSPSITQTVNKASTTIILISTANPSVYGQTVSFSASVQAVAPGTGTPTGTVTFFDGATELGTFSMFTGSADVTSALLSVGSHSITAVYNADTNYNGSTSSPLTQVINKANTVADVTSSVDPSVFGEPVTFTVRVSPVAPAGGIPTGTVTFTQGVTNHGTLTLDGNGRASLQISSLGVGGSSVSVNYSGDTNHNSTFGSHEQTVNKAGSSVALSSSLNPSELGDAVTFSATVSAVAPGGGIPSGNIELFVDSVSVETVSLDGSGNATFTSVTPAVGSYSVFARYAGSSSFNSDDSDMVTQVVDKATTTTAVTSSLNPSTFGDSVTFTATVSAAAGAGTPSGTVEFLDGSTSLATVTLDGSGQATFSTSVLLAGTHSIVASYGGATNFGSSSAQLDQVVNQIDTTTALAGPGTSTFGEAATFTATVTSALGTPSGTVEFFDGATSLGTGTLDGSGEATLTTSALAAGAHSLTATYAGSTNYAGSTSSSTPHTVNQAMTSLTITGPATSVMGQSVTFTATVDAVAPGAGTPTGDVQFVMDGIGPQTVALSGNTASITVTFPVSSATPYTVYAEYSGDTDFQASNNNTTHTVSNADTTTTVSASPSPSSFGETVTFTATVAAVSPGGGTPGNALGGGDVTFTIDGVPQTPVTVCCGSATLDVSDLGVGSHIIGAIFANSLYYNGSTASTITHTVTAVPTTTVMDISPTQATFGEDVNFTVNVTPNVGVGPVTGNVTLAIDGSTVGAVTLNGAGQAFFSVNTLTPGVHSVVASYGGATNFAPSSDMTSELIIEPDGVDVELTISPSPSYYGEAVTVTATVTPQNGQVAPTGTMLFVSSGAPVYVPLTNGTASFTTSSLPVGEDEFTAGYPGDANYLFGFSDDVTHEVVKDTTTTTVVSSLPTSSFGEDVTFTVTVAGDHASDSPSGTVTVTGLPSGDQTLTLSNGSATVSTNGLTGGTHIVTAAYGGDANFEASSGQVSQTVGQVQTTTAVISSPNPSHVGDTATFTATVSSSAGVPVGEVVFTVGGNSNGPIALDGSGVATFSTTALPSGDYTVEAAFAGSTNFAASSGTSTHTVSRHATETALTSTGSPTAVNQPVTFTATVSSPTGGTPDGSVIFTIDGVGTLATLDGAGIATLTTSALGVGDHTIEAGYGGSDGYEPSNGQTINHTVNPNVFPTQTSMSSSPNPSAPDEDITLTATVTAPNIILTPGGVVTFVVDNNTVGSASLVNGTATLTIAALAAGSHDMSAEYGGEGDFSPSSSPLHQHVVTGELVQTAVDVTSSLNPSTIGDTVTFTATVSAASGIPEGNVTFTIGGGDPTDVALQNGVATLTLASLPGGQHAIAAAYAGNATYESSSGFVIQTVDLNATETTLSSSPATTGFGETVTFTAAVTSFGGGTPIGNVVFTIDGTATPPVALDNGSATLTTNALAIGDHTVEASYEGSALHAASIAQPLTHTVTPNTFATVTELTTSPNPSVVGEGVGLSATVSAPGIAFPPTGAVTFFVDGQAVDTVQLTDGAASTTATGLSQGSHDIYAAYGGESDFAASVSNTVTQQVDVGTTTTALVSSLNPSAIGDAVSFTATVTASGGIPEGNVRFFDGGTEIGNVSLDGSGNATLTTTVLALGDHQIMAEYVGSASHTGSQSSLLTQTVLPPAVSTTTTLASSANPGIVGEPVTFTATVAAVGGGQTPEGSVAFNIDGSDQAGVTLSNGQATFTTSALSVGTHDVIATYGGAVGFAFSASPALTQQVDVRPTTLVLTSSLNPSTVGQDVTFTIEVTSPNGTPDGDARLTIGSIQQTAALSNGRASFTISGLQSNIHVVIGEYLGSPLYAGNSEIINQTVLPHPTTASLASSQNPSEIGQDVTFTATLTSDGGTPTGELTFFVDSARVATVALSGGQATFSTSTLSAGEHEVEAVYEGEGNFDFATADLTQTVNLHATETSLASSAETTAIGQPVTFTATVTGVGGGTPTGSVVFSIDGSSAQTVALVNGIAAMTTSDLLTGDHTIEAAYGGSAQHEASTAPPLVQTVLPLAFSTVTTLSSSANPSTVGAPVTLTATVTASGTTLTPEGTVSFSIDGVGAAAVQLVNGVATTTVDTLNVGAHQVTVEYGGEAEFLPSDGSLVQQVDRHGTATTLASSQNPSTVGQEVTFTATVTSASGTPTGDVIFTLDGTDGSPTPLAGGQATFTTGSLTAGQHTVVARYSASGDFNASMSAALTQTVSVGATTTALTSSQNPSKTGDPVTFTASVTGASGTPDGTVVFTIDGAAGSPVSLTGGTATVTVDNLAAGNHSIVAAYSGSAAYAASTSATLQQNVETRQTTTSLVSSLNPSNLDEEVTFTATIASSGATPAGEVVFSIDGVAQPPVAVAGGVATFATSSLTTGSHAIAAAYGGSSTHAASTSATLTQAVNDPDDSGKLREVQVQMTKMVAQASGQAISGAIDGAVSDGFSDGGGQLMEGSAGMLGFSLVPPQEVTEKSPESALDGLAGEGKLADRARAASNTLLGYGDKPLAVSMPNVGEQDPQKWRLWAKIHNTAWSAKPEKADIEGNQINFLAGVGYRLTPNFIIGAFGGYETFDYTSAPLNGRLEGDGWTVGGYLGWKITPSLRFDAGFARSELSYDASAGTAAGAFGGERWLLQSGLTGTHTMNGFEIEPSARIYALWENEDAYTDSLGAFHDTRSFSTARASGGVKVTYPVEGDGYVISPYLGLYADYYFSKDDASTDLTFEDAIQDGWSARVTAGFGLNLDGGAQLSIGGELGGLGEGGAPHGTVKGTLRIPF